MVFAIITYSQFTASLIDYELPTEQQAVKHVLHVRSFSIYSWMYMLLAFLNLNPYFQTNV